MSFNPQAQTFVLNQKLMSLSGDLWIDDSNGNHAFAVDGKALALRRTLVLQDPDGNALYEINQSLAHLHQTFEIKRGEQVVATIQKAMLNIMGDHFTISMADGENLAVTGDWIDREFHVTCGGSDVIFASRRLLDPRLLRHPGRSRFRRADGPGDRSGAGTDGAGGPRQVASDRLAS
jgi:uncharacterized protein YxjI